MQVFKDTTGQEWSIQIDFPTIKRIRRLIPGIDLGKPWDGKPTLIDRLRSEVELAVDVIFAIVQPQAAQLSITDEQFGHRLLNGGFEQAEAALWAEWSDFFHRTNRKAAAELVSKTGKMQAAMTAVATEEVTAMDVTEMAEKFRAEIRKTLTLGDSPTSSPHSAELTSSTATG